MSLRFLSYLLHSSSILSRMSFLLKETKYHLILSYNTTRGPQLRQQSQQHNQQTTITDNNLSTTIRRLQSLATISAPQLGDYTHWQQSQHHNQKTTITGNNLSFTTSTTPKPQSKTIVVFFFYKTGQPTPLLHTPGRISTHNPIASAGNSTPAPPASI